MNCARLYKMVHVVFWDNGLGERGTSVELFEYAHFNETILGNKSTIMYNLNHYSNKEYSVKRFKDRFTVIGVNQWSEVDPILKSIDCDVLYITKAGDWDGQVSGICKTVVHAVFTSCTPHGNVYASISDWLNTSHRTNIPVVPYIIRVDDTQENLRKELSIPDDAIVFGTYSGKQQFDIDYVRRAVETISKESRNINFIFLNIEPFFTASDRVRFLPGTSDMLLKRKFINTCDAMLYGRNGGETFGAAVGEFCISGKPIICRGVENMDYHLTILGDSAVKHMNYEDLYRILTTWKKGDHSDKICPEKYKRFSPENVMTVFKRIFL